MLRLFIALNLLLFNLYSCQGGYDSCIEKINDSKTIQNNSLHIPIKNTELLIWSKTTPNAKILKYDPFLSLYLIEDTNKFPYPFAINMRLQLGLAMVNTTDARESKVLKNQVGLNSFATFSQKTTTPALITSSCCSLEAIVTPEGIIQKEYLKRFLSSSKVAYSDIGIRVKNEGGYVLVSESDPYMKNNLFKKDDCILTFDGVKIKAASVLMRKVLFSKIGSKHKVQVKRDGKVLNLLVETSKRYGGGYVSDTFLEQKGVYFDKQLHITKLSQNFLGYGLLVGDRLIQVNGAEVKTQKELRKHIEGFKDFSSLLFERRNFQFFVNIK